MQLDASCRSRPFPSGVAGSLGEDAFVAFRDDGRRALPAGGFVGRGRGCRDVPSGEENATGGRDLRSAMGSAGQLENCVAVAVEDLYARQSLAQTKNGEAICLALPRWRCIQAQVQPPLASQRTLPGRGAADHLRRPPRREAGGCRRATVSPQAIGSAARAISSAAHPGTPPQGKVDDVARILKAIHAKEGRPSRRNFYNRMRKQAKLGFLSPAMFRQEYLARQLAA